MSVAYRTPDRYLDPMESSADYSSGAAAATGRDVPPRPGEALTVLGLETSCDETAASVVRLHPSDRCGRAEVLSSVVHSQIDDHAAYGGVVPEIAARSLAQHISFANPSYLNRDEVPEADVAKERDIVTEISRNEGKPEAALPKIVEGRLTGFFKESVLLDQAFAKDQKKSVGQVVTETGGTVTGFARFRVGA